MAPPQDRHRRPFPLPTRHTSLKRRISYLRATAKHDNSSNFGHLSLQPHNTNTIYSITTRPTPTDSRPTQTLSLPNAKLIPILRRFRIFPRHRPISPRQTNHNNIFRHGTIRHTRYTNIFQPTSHPRHFTKQHTKII